MIRVLSLTAAFVLTAVMTASAQASLTKAGALPTSANGGRTINDATSDSAYADQASGTLTIVPVNLGIRQKNWTALTGLAPSFVSAINFNPSGTRTAQSAGNYFRTYASGTGAFTASIRGIWNYVDVNTTGNVGTVYGGMNEVFGRNAGTKTDFRGSYNAVYAQNGGHIGTAYANMSIAEADGGSTIDTGIAFYGYAAAFGGTMGQGIAFYADGDAAPTYANKASFYAAVNSGQAQFEDGAYTDIMSHKASSVLTVSSNTIAPTNGIHHVGSGLIKTITVPTHCTPTCSVMLIPDAAFTTDTTGNISLASTAVTNRVMIMVWDGTKWNPSY